jgi:hypothetical protein
MVVNRLPYMLLKMCDYHHCSNCFLIFLMFFRVESISWNVVAFKLPNPCHGVYFLFLYWFIQKNFLMSSIFIMYRSIEIFQNCSILVQNLGCVSCVLVFLKLDSKLCFALKANLFNYLSTFLVVSSMFVGMWHVYTCNLWFGIKPMGIVSFDTTST